MSVFSFPVQVNERAARLVAAAVATTLLAALLLGATWIVPVMALGFLLRVGWGPRWSPLARIAMALAARLGPPKPVTGSPKRFAQGIGAACTITASVLFGLGATAAGWVVVAAVVLFATLEASVAFCMGCWIYGRLQRAGLVAENLCMECEIPRASRAQSK